MALPIVIAKNQTVTAIYLPRLGLTVPGSGQITLTDFASFYEISWDDQLNSSTNAGNIVINDGTSDLSASEGIGYLDATGNMNGPTSGLADNVLIKLNGTSGRYTKATGITIDASNNMNLGSGNLTTTGAVNTSGGSFTFPTALSPTPTTEGQAYWDTDDNVLRIGDGATTVTLSPTTSITLQLAYNNGPTVVTASSTDILFTLTSGGFTVNGSGTVAIGNGATTQTVNLGTGAGAKTVAVGSTTGASSLALDAGTGNINIGSSASARTINLGVAAAVVQTISIGGTGANVIVIGDTQNGGSVSVGAAMTTGTISIGGTGAQTGNIDIGTGTGVQTINLASGGTAAKTVTLGSTASTSSLTSRTGTGAMTFTAGGIYDVTATGAVTIDSSGGTIGIGTDAVAQNISVGTGAAARTIAIGNTTGASALNLAAGTGNTNITTAFTLNGIISPTAFTGTTQNDYNPTGLSGSSIIRQDITTANTTVTGLQGGVTGRVIIIENIGATFSIILSSQNAGSTAANRFAFSGDITLAPGDCVTLSYDGTSSRWRASGIAKAAAGASAASLQGAYNGGATITTASSTAIAFTLTSGGFTVNGTGTVDMGADATAQTLNFGTGAAVKTVSVGSTNSTSSTKIDSGTGNIDIGTGAQARTVNVGTGAAAQTITVGSSNTTSTLNLTAGSGNVNTTSALAWNGVISPTSLSTSQNNYNPTSLATASTIRQDASAAVNITGLSGGISGRIIVLYNISTTSAITLTNEDSSSTAANRFTLPLNIRLATGDSIILQYDGTSSRWRAPATSKGTVSGATKNRFYQFAANAATAKGDHNTVSVGANASINLELNIPDDFTTLVSIQAIMIPSSTNATANIDLASDYGAIGEVYNVNSESNTTNTYALTINQITGVDISSVAVGIAAGDFFGVTITHNAIGGAANYLGALLRYT